MEFDELAFLIEHAKSWVAAERATRRPQAQPLSDQRRQRFKAFFPANILDTAAVAVGPSIPNPSFYPQLAVLGRPIPLDFTKMAGITFVDTILIAQKEVASPYLDSLLFHECVHVVQYALLGLDQFMEQYVAGWAANDRQYERIPLEVEAYSLERRYSANPNSKFSVEEAVKQRLGV